MINHEATIEAPLNWPLSDGCAPALIASLPTGDLPATLTWDSKLPHSKKLATSLRTHMGPRVPLLQCIRLACSETVVAQPPKDNPRCLCGEALRQTPAVYHRRNPAAGIGVQPLV